MVHHNYNPLLNAIEQKKFTWLRFLPLKIMFVEFRFLVLSWLHVISPVNQLLWIGELTNREALTVLCSVVGHAGNGSSTKEVYGETRDVFECFSPLLESSDRFLSALQQNSTQSRLLYLFYNKESVKFSAHYFQFLKYILIPKRITVSSACSILS